MNDVFLVVIVIAAIGVVVYSLRTELRICWECRHPKYRHYSRGGENIFEVEYGCIDCGLNQLPGSRHEFSA